MSQTTTTQTNWLTGLYSERANRAGDGMVGLDPKWVNQVIALGGGFPDPQSLPIQDIIESTRIALERDGEWALQYAPGSGIPELVDELRKKLERDQGIVAERENILITSGGSQALGLIWELLINPGDVLLSESPFFLGAVQRCREFAADVREIPLDGQGIVIEELERTLEQLQAEGKQPKFLYLVPNFQNPTGITYSLERRKAIIALAQRHHFVILEDDAYYDLRFDGQKVPTFYELDDEGLVLYVGTFSKIIGAGIRIGWIVGSAPLIARLSGLKYDFGTNVFASHVVAEFTRSGTLTEHIAQLKGIYRDRRDVMLAALEQSMPVGTSWTHPEGGFFIWLTLPDGVTCGAVVQQARERGVGVGMGSMFYVHGGGQDKIRLSYSFNTDEQIQQGIGILAEVVKEQAGG